jgi:hypothetical protein
MNMTVSKLKDALTDVEGKTTSAALKSTFDVSPELLTRKSATRLERYS